jgi:hypothetical protein
MDCDLVLYLNGRGGGSYDEGGYGGEAGGGEGGVEEIIFSDEEGEVFEAPVSTGSDVTVTFSDGSVAEIITFKGRAVR